MAGQAGHPVQTSPSSAHPPAITLGVPAAVPGGVPATVTAGVPAAVTAGVPASPGGGHCGQAGR